MRDQAWDRRFVERPAVGVPSLPCGKRRRIGGRRTLRSVGSRYGLEPSSAAGFSGESSCLSPGIIRGQPLPRSWLLGFSHSARTAGRRGGGIGCVESVTKRDQSQRRDGAMRTGTSAPTSFRPHSATRQTDGGWVHSSRSPCLSALHGSPVKPSTATSFATTAGTELSRGHSLRSAKATYPCHASNRSTPTRRDSRRVASKSASPTPVHTVSPTGSK